MKSIPQIRKGRKEDHNLAGTLLLSNSYGSSQSVPAYGEIASTAVAAASELLRLVHHFAAKNCFEDDHVFESILWHREDIIGEYGHVGILARLD